MSRKRLYAIYALSVLYGLTWIEGIVRNDYSGLTQITPPLATAIGVLIGYDRRNGKNGAPA